MAYTDVWDVTAPLDSQAAAQGAADFRATKLDVMQRIASFGAGILANRPTPETTGATADWTGVMYWATDTKQAFMWNGTAWVDISSNVPSSTTAVVFSSAAAIVAPAGTGLNTIYSGTVNANSMGSNGGVRVGFNVQPGGGHSGTYGILITLGAGNVYADSGFDGNTSTDFDIFIQNSTANAQTTYGLAIGTGANPNKSGVAVTAVDTTVNQLLTVQFQKTNGTDSWNLFNGFAKIA